MNCSACWIVVSVTLCPKVTVNCSVFTYRPKLLFSSPEADAVITKLDRAKLARPENSMQFEETGDHNPVCDHKVRLTGSIADLSPSADDDDVKDSVVTVVNGHHRSLRTILIEVSKTSLPNKHSPQDDGGLVKACMRRGCVVKVEDLVPKHTGAKL
ncbi:hypothetical protein CBL_10749 [Carabus blaptoides fortunei]